MSDRLQFRRDTKKHWEEANPILLEGEVAFESDTTRYKLGDGIHKFIDLPYRSFDGEVTIGMLDEQIIQIIQNSGTKTINNYPDGEDLEISTNNGLSVIKFADKDYSYSDNSGLGRVYVRKGNIINQITKPNTIYIIQYDHNLNEETLTIPENCVLKFEGGSLRNGNIILNDTLILNNNNTVFKNIILSGSILNKFISNNFSDNIINIFNLLESSNTILNVISDIEIDSNDILTCNIPSIKGNGHTINTNNIIFQTESNNILFKDISFETNISIDVNNDTNSTPYFINIISSNWKLYINNVNYCISYIDYNYKRPTCFLSGSNGKKINIQSFNGCGHIIFKIFNSNNINIDNIKLNNFETGLYFRECNNIIVQNSCGINTNEQHSWYKNYHTADINGKDFILAENICNNLTIKDIYCEKIIERSFYIQASNVNIYNVVHKDCGAIKCVGVPITNTIAENIRIYNISFNYEINHTWYDKNENVNEGRTSIELYYINNCIIDNININIGDCTAPIFVQTNKYITNTTIQNINIKSLYGKSTSFARFRHENESDTLIFRNINLINIGYNSSGVPLFTKFMTEENPKVEIYNLKTTYTGEAPRDICNFPIIINDSDICLTFIINNVYWLTDATLKNCKINIYSFQFKYNNLKDIIIKSFSNVNIITSNDYDLIVNGVNSNFLGSISKLYTSRFLDTDDILPIMFKHSNNYNIKIISSGITNNLQIRQGELLGTLYSYIKFSLNPYNIQEDNLETPEYYYMTTYFYMGVEITITKIPDRTNLLIKEIVNSKSDIQRIPFSRNPINSTGLKFYVKDEHQYVNYDFDLDEYINSEGTLASKVTII